MIGSALTMLDEALFPLPGWSRVSIYAAIAGVLAMLIYKRTSLQDRISDAARRAALLRKQLNSYTGDFDGAKQLILESLAVSLRRVWLTLGPSLVAGVPVILLFTWMDQRFDRSLPAAGQTVAITTTPSGPGAARFVPSDTAVWDDRAENWNLAWPDESQRVELLDTEGVPAVVLPMPAATAVIANQSWFGLLFANASGYLPNDCRLQSVTFNLPRRELLPFGPRWARGWLCLSICSITAAALLTKVVFKIS